MALRPQIDTCQWLGAIARRDSERCHAGITDRQVATVNLCRRIRSYPRLCHLSAPDFGDPFCRAEIQRSRACRDDQSIVALWPGPLMHGHVTECGPNTSVRCSLARKRKISLVTKDSFLLVQIRGVILLTRSALTWGQGLIENPGSIKSGVDSPGSPRWLS